MVKSGSSSRVCSDARPPAPTRCRARPPDSRRAAGEHLDVPRLVGGLDGQQLHHLAEVRVQLAEQPRRDDQRRLLVLDQVGHELHDGALDLVGQRRAAAVQSTAVAGIPLAGGRGARTAAGRCRPRRARVRSSRAPMRRAARLDERAAGGEAPARVGARRPAGRRPRRPAPRRASAARRPCPSMTCTAAGVTAGGAGLGVGGSSRWPCSRHQAARCTRSAGCAAGDGQPRRRAAARRSARSTSRWPPSSRPRPSRSIVGVARDGRPSAS